MPHIAKTLATFLVAALLVAIPASADPPKASAAAKCSVRGKERSFGSRNVSYVTVLSTRRVTCANAVDFVKRYHRCRYANGGKKGHCGGVRGFKCEERRYNKIDISFDANVLCTRGASRIRHTYTMIL